MYLPVIINNQTISYLKLEKIFLLYNVAVSHNRILQARVLFLSHSVFILDILQVGHLCLASIIIIALTYPGLLCPLPPCIRQYFTGSWVRCFTHLKLLFFKVAKEHGLVCAWDLEQFGYQELEVSSKLELFKVVKNIFWISHSLFLNIRFTHI